MHLHVRSGHSHLFGASRPEELIRTACDLGYHDLALTDRNGLYGAVAFYRQARQAGLKPIVGVELAQGTVPFSGLLEKGTVPFPAQGAVPFSPEAAKRVQPPGRAVCLARNLEGYRTLCRLVTARQLSPGFDLAEILASDHKDIYVLAPDAALLIRLAGRLPPGRLLALIEEFGDRLMRLRNGGLARAATQRRVPLVAGGAVAFHVPSLYAAHRALRAIALRKNVADVPRRERAHPKAYLKGPEEMAALFRDYPEAAANTVRLAADCNLDLPLGRPIFPNDGETPYSHLADLQQRDASIRNHS